MTDLEEITTIIDSVHLAVGCRGHRPEAIITAMVQVISEVVENADEISKKELFEEVILSFTSRMIMLGVKRES